MGATELHIKDGKMNASFMEKSQEKLCMEVSKSYLWLLQVSSVAHISCYAGVLGMPCDGKRGQD